MDKVYPSKKDTWLVIVLWLAILAMLASMAGIAFSGASFLSILLQEILMLGIVVFCISLLRNTNYTFTQDELIVRSGPFREIIPLAAIQSAVPSRKAWSSAALSLDRLFIQYKGSKRGTYISPENKNAFLRDLADRSPDLFFEFDRVVKKEAGDKDS